ncbi:MAG TPA: tetratricopeptide repeat protein [Polyangiales bacterium]|nr:tetratricopeptide repeat protein [Polyangiales bacterium]
MSQAGELSGDRHVRRTRLFLLAIVTAFCLLYARTASYDFVWDDVDAIIHNPLYEGPWLTGLRASQHDHLDLSLRQQGLSRPMHDSYRPVLYASHRCERALFGRSPVAHHLHNVVVALCAIGLAFALARRCLDDDAQALAVTAIFALHPLQVEPIAYVSGRGDLLSACFALASLWLAMRAAERTPELNARRASWAALAALSYVLALLCKEAYVGLPLVLGLIAWSRGRLRFHVIDFTAQALGLGLYLWVRLSMARSASSSSGIEGALLLPGLWLQYLRIMLEPIDLSIVRPFDEHMRVPGWVALGALGALALSVARKPLTPRTAALRRIVAGLLMALALIGPSAIVVRIMGVVADRYVYLPLFGFALALVVAFALLLTERPTLRLPLYATASGCSLIWLAFTLVQIPVWRDPGTLYTHAAAIEPASERAVYGLASWYAHTGRCDRATPLFERAIELDPRDGRAWNNLAVCALNGGDYARALVAAQNAISFASAPPFRALYNEGLAYLRLGEESQGCKALRRALSINPAYQQAAELSRRVCSVVP